MPTGEPTPTNPAERYCPVCGTRTEDKICPQDGTRTVLKQKFSKDALAYEPGDLVNDRYRITGILGRGGFGAVYAAEHTGTGQGVALKMLTLDTTLDEDGEHTKRFFQEARMTAQLTHANTVRVFDVGQADEGPLFIAMEMLRGPSLAQYLRDVIDRGEALSEAATLDIAIPMLKSLGEAHKAGLVHRDIKPANVHLHQGPDDETIVKLLDFGIARAANSQLTATGRALGTPSYMSPEQCTGQTIDGRSDLYAVGILMFLCVTGKLPFAGDDSMAVMFMQVNAPMPDPRSLTNHDLSNEFVAALTKTLEKNPEKRFVNAREMRRALESVRGGAWGGTPTFGLDTETALRTVGSATVNRTTGEKIDAQSDPGEMPTQASGTVRTQSVAADEPEEATIATSVTPARIPTGSSPAAAATDETSAPQTVSGVTGEDQTIATTAAPASAAAPSAQSQQTEAVAPIAATAATAADPAASANISAVAAPPAAPPKSGFSANIVIAALVLVVGIVAAAVILKPGPKPAPAAAAAPTKAAAAPTDTPQTEPGAAPSAASALPTKAAAAAAKPAEPPKAAPAPQAPDKPAAAADKPVDPALEKAKIVAGLAKGEPKLALKIQFLKQAVKLAPANADYRKRLLVAEAKRDAQAKVAAEKRKQAAAAKRATHKPRPKTKPKPAAKKPSTPVLQPEFAD